MTLPAALRDAKQAHFAQLIAAKEQEGPHVDFKRELPAAWNEKAKHDFISDTSAFANAGGGYLIFGMAQDKDGRAAALVPQEFNPDAGSMQMESMLRDGVEPSMPGVQVHPVPVEVDGQCGYVVVVHAPQSWVGPHRLKTTRHFYVRDGRQSRPVSVPELRGLFLRSESHAQRVRDFRTDRLAKVLTGETPYKLAAGPVLVLHLVPLQAVLGRVDVDPVQYLGLRRGIPVVAARSGAVDTLVNLDGAAGTRNLLENGTNGYTLLFRNGFVETTWVLNSSSPTDRALLPGGAFEDYVAQFVTAAGAELAHWGAAGQVIAMLSITIANDVTLDIQREYAGTERGKFDRRVLTIPDIELAGEGRVHDELKPLFDLVWQSAGFHGSPHYDDSGRWAGTSR
jgi:hypothetical protein